MVFTPKVGIIIDEIILSLNEMVNPVKLMQMRNEAVAMQKKMQARKIVGESRDSQVKLQMNAAQELESLIVDESIIDEQTLKIINNGIKEAFKDYQKKLQKEMVKDVDLDQIKKLLG